MVTPLRVGLVAGEASGDTLGAALIQALERLAPGARFFGIAGPKMQAAGCEVWEPSESLAVMGLFEILRDLPRLFELRARIRRQFLRAKPDVFVGIDAPEFNLRTGAAIARGRHPDGAVREPAGMGMAARPGAQHSPIGRFGAVFVALRKAASTTTGAWRRSSSGIRWRTRYPSMSIGRRRARHSGSSPAPRSSPCCPAAGAGR